MLYALVHAQNQILSTLLKGSKNVNRIINDTSAGKKFDTHKKKVLYEYLPNLEKIGLVTRRIDEKVHKQIENIELTEIGSELADIVDGMEKFYKSHHLLSDTIKQIYIPGDPIKNDSFRRKLRDKGLGEQEIESYNQDSEDARYFEKESLSMCINGLKSRYIFIVSKFTLNNTQQDYLLKTIANMINECTLMELESLKNEVNHHFTCEDCGHELSVSQTIRDQQRSAFVLIESAKEVFEYIDKNAATIFTQNRFILDEKKGVLSSIFYIYNPPRHLLEQHIKEGREFMNTEIEQRADLRYRQKLYSIRDLLFSFYDGILSSLYGSA